MSKLIDTLGLNGAQITAVTERHRDVVVIAGAGSGKTRTLAARYTCLLDDGLPPRSLIAITFTEKAAREMRNRIRQTISAWRRGDCPEQDQQRWQTIEADIDTARIGTIHSLCANLLRAHPAEAEIDPLFQVLDEGLAATLQAQVVEDTLSWAIDQIELKPLFAAFDTRALAEILSKLLVHRLETAAAGAQSDPLSLWNEAIMRVTVRFARSSPIQTAIEDLRRLRASESLVDDAGDKLAGQVQGLLSQWSIVEETIARHSAIDIAMALYDLRHNHCDGRSGKKSSLAKDAVRTIREAYDRTLQPWLGGRGKDDPRPDPAVERRAADLATLMRILFDHADSAYREAKDIRQALDFDDLEWGALRLLRDAGIRARWQRQTAAILVDEFQDTNERQRCIVEALAGINEGNAGRLFVVGDAKQSIYRFRGADVTVFRQLDHDIRGRGGLAVNLDLTFRAHKALVGALNGLLGEMMGETDCQDKPFAVPFVKLNAHRQESRETVSAPYVEFLCGLGSSALEGRTAAARLLVQRLREMRDQEEIDWGDVALLFRASTGFPDYEAALEAAGIPFATVAGRGFYDRPEIRDLLNILTALADPWNDLAMAGLLRSPAFGLTDVALYQLRWPMTTSGSAGPMPFRTALHGDLSQLSTRDRQLATRARDIVDHLSGLVDRVSVAELLKQVLDQTMYPGILAAANPGARLQRNVDKLLADAHASGLVRVTEFLEYVETLRESGAREGEAPSEAGGAVQLLTVHKAKGLEFPVVVIADATRVRPGSFDRVLLSPDLGMVLTTSRDEPSSLAFRLVKAVDKEQSEAEDLRLLYVAATRAREKLIVCGHHTGREPDAWMSKLLQAANIELSALIEQPGHWITTTLAESGQEVRGMAAALSDMDANILPETENHRAPTSRLKPLYSPPDSGSLEEIDDSTDTARRPTTRVTRHREHYDGTVVGKLVHEALQRWRFPGDPGLDGLLMAASAKAGLVDPSDIKRHIDQAIELLQRLRRDPRWTELDQAPRQHEVPYTLYLGDKVSSGTIDLLYRSADHRWHVIDFKTDTLSVEAEVSQLIEAEYGSQLRRYRQAVARLLDGEVEATICFLDFTGKVRWENVL